MLFACTNLGAVQASAFLFFNEDDNCQMIIRMGQGTDDRGQMTDDRGLRAEDRRQRTDDRGSRSGILDLGIRIERG